MSTKRKLPAHEVGSGNIFADLGLPNAERHQLKALLVVQLKRLIAERHHTSETGQKRPTRIRAGLSTLTVR